MKTGKRFVTVMAVAVVAMGMMTANAQTVWNVNIGGEDLTGYQGAATNNNPVSGSTWNAVTTYASTTLNDSSGDNTAGVTISMAHAVGAGDPDVADIHFGTQSQTTGDPIFKSYMKDDNNADAVTVTFGGLSAAATYDLVVYSGWRFGPEALQVEQSAGTGLDGIFIINSRKMQDGHPLSTGLAEDTNAADVAGDFNYARFNGLTADSGNLAFDFFVGGDRDAPICGFQLVEFPPAATPGTLIYGK
ncbi:MAG: hypothetical protein HN919_09005 [Verrucomicrobia bacterium]|jgi:hypothetical protein|nr:hypothetical protein [Verrucomicrobiota bacterium]